MITNQLATGGFHVDLSEVKQQSVGWAKGAKTGSSVATFVRERTRTSVFDITETVVHCFASTRLSHST